MNNLLNKWNRSWALLTIISAVLMAQVAAAQTEEGAVDAPVIESPEGVETEDANQNDGEIEEDAVSATSVDNSAAAVSEDSAPNGEQSVSKIPLAEVDITPKLSSVDTHANDDEDQDGSKEKISDYVGYDGGFYLKDESGKYSLKVNARMQAKYMLETVDTGEDEKEIESNFSIPAARLKLKGHVISKSISYALQLDFGKGNALLKDFYADFAFVKNKFHLRVGQWVKPFSRQQITSSGKLEFTGRAMTDKAFGAGRDIGLAFHNNYSKSPGFEWALGLFNGTGEKPKFKGSVDVDENTGEIGDVTGKFSNVPSEFHPMMVVRLGFNTGNLKGYSEADLEGGGPRLGVGASGLIDFDADNNNDSAVRGELDYIFKAYGFSSTGGFYAATAQNGVYFKDQGFGALGMHAQLGYVIAGRIQPVFRYGVLDSDGKDTFKQEIFGGISLYFAKHNLKWQTEIGGLLEKDGEEDFTNTVVATQLQLAF